MPTGDGLLARLMPPAPLSLETFAALCDASQAHGNGIMEVTQRGSLQVRGLSPDSATRFARTAAALGLGEGRSPVILASPLFGLDARESAELPALGAALRARIGEAPRSHEHRPEGFRAHRRRRRIAFGRGAADLRLRLMSSSRCHLSMAGNAAAAMNLGWVEPGAAVQAIARILIAIADRGETARARDFANDAGDTLRASLAGMLIAGSAAAVASARRTHRHAPSERWAGGARNRAALRLRRGRALLKRLAHAAAPAAPLRYGRRRGAPCSSSA